MGKRETPIAIHSIDNNTLSDFTSSICAGQNLEKRGKEKVFPLLIKS
jgi:hypothetical protein